VGDLVKAVEENFEPFLYKGKPIFAGEISLLVYPVETIFAEKLETIISKGAANSRMKDYHVGRHTNPNRIRRCGNEDPTNTLGRS